jgi:hypothetical protein
LKDTTPASRTPPLTDKESPHNDTAPDRVDFEYFLAYDPDHPTKAYITKEQDALENLRHANLLIFLLCRSDFKYPFTESRIYNRLAYKIDQTGELLIQFLMKLEHVHSDFQRHELNPQLRTLIETAQSVSLNIAPGEVRFIQPHEYEATANEYNALARKLREALLADGMRERVKSFRRNAANCRRQFLTSLQQRIDQHSKVLFISLVHGDRKTIPWIPAEKIDESTFHQQASLIGQRRDQMVKHLKKQFGKHLVFYCWRIEWGKIKGLHIHWFIVLNGSKYGDRISVPFHISKHWDSVIGQGKTHTHNINALQSGERSGLRVLSYYEKDLPHHALRFARYFTKIDNVMKLRLPPGMRSFGCSKQIKATTKRGPRRSYLAPHRLIDEPNSNG